MELSEVFKRFLGYIISRVICIIPVIKIAEKIFDEIFCSPNLVHATDLISKQALGLGIFTIIGFSLSPLFGSFYYYFFDGGALNDFQCRMFFYLLSVILAHIIVEYLVSLIFKIDIGSKILGFILLDSSGEPIGFRNAIWRIFIRTTIKYISIGFFPPILLFPLFNKRRLFFHEWVSDTEKIWY